jgi:transcriptional regulator with XRE-family HTH domain
VRTTLMYPTPFAKANRHSTQPPSSDAQTGGESARYRCGMTAHRAMAEFLRARREHIRPVDVGIPDNGKRRVSGLRREEVASLAGISVDYYLRLEQGRELVPSQQVLDALSTALLLDDEQRLHLRELATAAVRGVDVSGHEIVVDVGPLLQAVTLPAFAQNRFMDVLDVNAAGRALLANVRPGTNLLRAAFLEPRVAMLYEDWKDVAADAVAHLRSLAGADIAHPRMVQLVDEISAASPLFRELWARGEVDAQPIGRRRIDHPALGAMDMSFAKLDVPGPTRVQLVIYYSDPGSESEAKLARLTAG